MNKLVNSINIENMIYEIRGSQVMLDSDLARLYQVETKRINEAVYRNQEKFPKRISWIADTEDVNNLWSQNATANISSKSRTNPRLFTEQGVYMLATILKSKVAIDVSITIMDAFVHMRHYFSSNSDILINHENRLLKLEKTFDKFQVSEKTNKIFFEGQMYDAYSLLIDILKLAREEIIIIDNYVGKELLDILKSIDQRIIIVSKNIDNVLKKKYEQQYNNIIFQNNDSFHDRFIIIDRIRLYASGSSFKDLGKKCFYIGEVNNKYLDEVLLVIESEEENE